MSSINRSPSYERDSLRVLNCDGRHTYNFRNHQTHLYELAKRPNPTHLVLRRGEPVSFFVQFSRLLNPTSDSLSVILKYVDCEKPMIGQKTFSMVPISYVGEDIGAVGSWKGWIKGPVKSNIIDLRVLPPHDCLIGRWTMEIDTKLKFAPSKLTYDYPHLLYIIFNPFSKGDEVYMEPEYLYEYLLNENGLLYKGSRVPKPTHWVYGQFAKNVLECCFFLVNEKTRLSVAMRSDPVLITRGLTSVIHSDYSPGILMGNWSGDYSDGTRPQLWAGSAPILQKYFANPTPVKYGQCWVYAGVMTTVCRALGIAARSVTCYSCGFGPDDTISIDVHYYENPEMAGKKNQRAFWNYHVWTECWMKRTDIGKQFDGWQVLDASPQFPTAGIVNLGPASVLAIKGGKFRTPYDTSFVYHEVNGDIHYWKSLKKDQEMKFVSTKKKSVGWFIGTKGQTTWTIEDITTQYKEPDGEKGYRRLVTPQPENTRVSSNTEFSDIEFDLRVEKEVDIGKPLRCELQLKNTHIWQTFIIQVKMVMMPITHNGRRLDILKFEKYEVTLQPKTDATVSLSATYDEYRRVMLSEGLFNCACQARVEDVDFDFYDEDTIQIVQPTFTIRVPEPIVGIPVRGVAEFVNPLNVSLTNGVVYIQGHFFKEVQKVKIGTIPPKKKMSFSFDLTALSVGEFSIAVKFFSDQLSEVEGFIRVKSRRAEDIR